MFFCYIADHDERVYITLYLHRESNAVRWTTCDANQALATASQIFNPKMKQIKLIRISTKVSIQTSVCIET